MYKDTKMKIESTATAFITNHQGKVLLIKRTKDPWKNLWGFPGGHVNKNETPRQAVIREVREETGLAVTPGKKPVEVFLYPVLDHCHKSHLFRCAIKGSARLRPEKEWRHEGTLRWCQTRKRDVNPVVKYALEKYVE